MQILPHIFYKRMSIYACNYYLLFLQLFFCENIFLTTCCFWLLVISFPNLLYICMSVCACLSPLDIKFFCLDLEFSGGHQHHALISILKWWYNQQCGPDSGPSHAPMADRDLFISPSVGIVRIQSAYCISMNMHSQT